MRLSEPRYWFYCLLLYRILQALPLREVEYFSNVSVVFVLTLEVVSRKQCA